jgi:hypothetical protein
MPWTIDRRHTGGSVRGKPRTIRTVDEAIELLGGDARVAKWLRIDPSELDRMRHFGCVDRGFFAHFHLTLTALGHTPAPQLFGVKSWRIVIMPDLRSL